MHFEGNGPISLAKKLPKQQQPVLRMEFCNNNYIFIKI